MSVRILTGDCREVLTTLDVGSVAACVTDPPYDLTGASRNGSPRQNDPTKPHGRHNLQPAGGFMGKKWDGTGIAFDAETWLAVKRVLRPGGYLLAFGGTRTYHRMVCAIEDAGFEIKDCLSWLYGSGFPKHKSLLKPAWEPIVLARKPGSGVLNVDACRIGDGGQLQWEKPRGMGFSGGTDNGVVGRIENAQGRWPANVMLDEDAAAALDAMSGELTSGSRTGKRNEPKTKNTFGSFALADERPSVGDSGGASRFFYVAKADRSERDIGMWGTPTRSKDSTYGDGFNSATKIRTEEQEQHGVDRGSVHNHHPTVKPIALMQWLVRLVTPKDGTVLDPFMGSGSTGIAADREGFSFIGIEQDAEYAEIARRRIIGDAPLFASVEVA